ncbi:MAG TPA: glycosyltransferase, partial [Planctomycetota bacterium]|nr:glycosyltransferase [Planctomycetota bacterium]
MTRTVAIAAKRVIFDARPGESCVTGIGRYARTMKTLMKGVPGHVCFSLGEDLKWSPKTPIEEELELPALLEREGCQVFHSPLFHLPAVLSCQAVVTVHDAIPLVKPELSNLDFTKLFKAQAQEACERADAIVCPSEHAKNDVVAALGLRAEKIHVI